MQRVSVDGHEPKPRMLAGSFDATQPFRLSFSQAPLESDTSGVTGAFLGLVKGTFHNQPRPRLEPQGHQVPCFSVQAWQATPEPGPVPENAGNTQTQSDSPQTETAQVHAVHTSVWEPCCMSASSAYQFARQFLDLVPSCP